MKVLVDLVITALTLGLTYALASEGLWGAATMFFNVLFAGIIAFNFYEPLATLLDGTGIGWGFSDTLCLMSLFIVSLTLLRLTTESLAPSMVRFPNPVYHAGRIFFALAGSVVTVSILLLGLETAPVHKKILGSIDYAYQPPFERGFDRRWLGFFQWTTGAIFPDYSSPTRDWLFEYGNAKVFDPKAEWLIIHQDARPYGTETVLGGEGGGDAAGAAGAAAGGAAAPPPH